jgi:hypothetical protein
VLVSRFASLVPQGLAELSSEERNRVYKTMGLRIFADRDDTLIADSGCNASPLPRWSSTVTTFAFKFRAVLSNDKGIEVELNRV